MCTVERVHAGRMRGGGRGSEVRTNVCGRVHVRRMRGEQMKKANINVCGGEGACEKNEGEE